MMGLADENEKYRSDIKDLAAIAGGPVKSNRSIRSELLRLEEEMEIDIDFIAAEAGDRELSATEKIQHRAIGVQRGKRFKADMLFVLTQRPFTPEQAERLWHRILQHKDELQHRLGRNVGIVVASLDYLTNIRDILNEPSVVPSSKMTTVAEIAVKDGLTDLYDHSTFQTRLAKEVRRATRYSDDLALVMLDLDRFKSFNDTHGHRAGDRVLAEVASVIGQEIRETDMGARYGGEEFAVIAPSTGLEKARMLAERIRCRTEELFSSQPITLSAGVAAFDGEIATARDLIHAADKALYHSKQSGRNRTTMWFSSANNSGFSD